MGRSVRPSNFGGCLRLPFLVRPDSEKIPGNAWAWVQQKRHNLWKGYEFCFRERMKKSERLHHHLGAREGTDRSMFPREYRAFFECFNAGEFYQAHDVLEHLWLRCTDANRSFYQGLIQVAGAFVHFQKQRLFPNHPVHGRRLAPGVRLLRRAQERLRAYPSPHMGLDLEWVQSLSRQCVEQVQAGCNPLVHSQELQLVLVE